MTATERLTAFLREQPAIPVPHRGKDDPRPAIEAALALAQARPVVHALLTTLVERDTQFALFDLEIYPAVLARTPWREGVMTPRELCVAKNGAGDLYLWNVDDDSVRFVIHDEDWSVRSRSRSFDVFLEGAMWTCLELLQVEDLDEMDEAYRARIRFAAELVGQDPIDEEVRARLVELGVLAG